MAGAGKSSLGKELAKHLDFNFIDSDKLIETIKNKPLQEILDENGIERFKKIEEAALLSVEFNKTILTHFILITYVYSYHKHQFVLL